MVSTHTAELDGCRDLHTMVWVLVNRFVFTFVIISLHVMFYFPLPDFVFSLCFPRVPSVQHSCVFKPVFPLLFVFLGLLCFSPCSLVLFCPLCSCFVLFSFWFAFSFVFLWSIFCLIFALPVFCCLHLGPHFCACLYSTLAIRLTRNPSSYIQSVLPELEASSKSYFSYKKL